MKKYILSRVRSSVTNNNGFWIGWLDLLTPSFTLNYNSSQSICCRGLAPFSFSCLNTIATSELNSTTELSERSHVSSLYNFGKNWTEITTSNCSFIIAYLFFAAETCLGTRYPTTDILLLLRAQLRECVYRVVAYQWSYAWQYIYSLMQYMLWNSSTWLKIQLID
jgi:hypothetical protein